LKDLAGRLAGVEWDAQTLGRTLKEVVGAHGMKLPQLAIPLRVALLGQTQTPAIDAVLEVLGRQRVLSRLERVL
jgi:glutamyl-tRNA synthetase